MTKLRKLKPEKNSGSEFTYRIARGTVADTEQRTVDMVLATEAPIPTFDFERMDVIDEVLDLDGAETPNQIPLVDSHDRQSVRNVLGSIRDIRREGDQLLGRAYFSSNPEAVAVFRNYEEGHLTDFSVGARRVEVENSGGTRFIRRSQVVEGSAVVVGADANAKALSAFQRAYLEPDVMRAEAMAGLVEDLRAEFEIPEDVPADDVPAWLKENRLSTAEESEETESEESEMAGTETTTTATRAAECHEDNGVQLDRAAIEKELLQRVADVQLVCRNAGLDQAEIDKHVATGRSANDIAGDILRAKHQQQTSEHSSGVTVEGEIQHGASEHDKTFAAIGDGLLTRALANAELNPSKVAENSRDIDAVERSRKLAERMSNPASGAADFRHARLTDIARICAEAGGVRTTGMPVSEVVRAAMSVDLQRATHTTGSFANLLLDAANKTLLAAYDEQMASYSMWARRGSSVADFKNINRIRFGEAPNPEVVPEGFPYPDKTVSDSKESYKVEKHGELFSITLEAVVNDDLDAISRLPAMQGAAMRRKINKVVYQILADNAALSDGIALFHASSHGANLDSTALAEAALDTGFSVMRQQTGISSDAILNLRPSYLIVPSGLAATAHRLVSSNIVPESVSNVPLYGPGGVRPLTVIEDGEIDSLVSSTAWYLAASPAAVDTVEYTFLQGEESPVLSREEGFETDTIKYKIRQTFGAKAIDFRGLYQGNG